MRAAVLEAFGQPLVIQDYPDPILTQDGAIVRVEANGICRSDWHAWVGDWRWLKLPHVLGHELSGVVVEVGAQVSRFHAGDRVIVPFTQGDGTCPSCQSGHQNVCEHATMPGFSYAGGMAPFVHIPHADRNLVPLPEAVSFQDAAALGCRYMTAFHGLIDQIGVRAGEQVVIYGCGGVGLSAVQIAKSQGAFVIAVDISEDKLAWATQMGADAVLDGQNPDVAQNVRALTHGGADVSVDALGRAATIKAAIRSLRIRGRHLQIGMASADDRNVAAFPVDVMVQREISVQGTFGMAPHRYGDMLRMVERGQLHPGSLVSRTVNLEQVSEVLQDMGEYRGNGITVLTQW